MDGVPVTLAEAWAERGPAPILPTGRIPPEYLGSEKIGFTERILAGRAGARVVFYA